MSLETVLIVVTVVFLIAIKLYFHKKKKTVRATHIANIMDIQKAIHLHQKQINNREACLQRYDFTRYNLKEVLVVQADILL